MSALAPALQAFFTDRLIGQRDASPNTIAAYRTGLCLLLGFAAERTGKSPSVLDITALDAPLIAAFLDHLEQDRHNSVATRNSRLAAIHSLFAYLALHHPEHAGSIQRVLAIPMRRISLVACATTSCRELLKGDAVVSFPRFPGQFGCGAGVGSDGSDRRVSSYQPGRSRASTGR